MDHPWTTHTGSLQRTMQLVSKARSNIESFQHHNRIQETTTLTKAMQALRLSLKDNFGHALHEFLSPRIIRNESPLHQRKLFPCIYWSG